MAPNLLAAFASSNMFAISRGGGVAPGPFQDDAGGYLPITVRGDSGGPCIEHTTGYAGDIVGILHAGDSNKSGGYEAPEWAHYSAASGFRDFVDCRLKQRNQGIWCDADGDGVADDKASIGKSALNTLTFVLEFNNGAQKVELVTPIPDSVADVGCLIPGDFDADGDADLLSTVGAAISALPSYFNGAAFGSFSFTNTATWNPAGPYAYYTVGRFNGDTVDDVRAVRFDGSEDVFLGEKNVGLTSAARFMPRGFNWFGPGDEEAFAISAPGSNVAGNCTPEGDACASDADCCGGGHCVLAPIADAGAGPDAGDASADASDAGPAKVCQGGTGIQSVVGRVHLLVDNLSAAPDGLENYGLSLTALKNASAVPFAYTSSPGDLFGKALAWGSFDGIQERHDLVIGAPGVTAPVTNTDGGIVQVPNPGMVAVFRYDSSAQSENAIALDRNALSGAAQSNAGFGQHLAAGDFNGDSRDDLAVRSASDVQILYGQAGVGLKATGSEPIFTSGDLGLGLPASLNGGLTTGDFNCDGYEDLAIGDALETITVPGPDGGVSAISGAVVILYGGSSGLDKNRQQRIDRNAVAGLMPRGCSLRAVDVTITALLRAGRGHAPFARGPEVDCPSQVNMTLSDEFLGGDCVVVERDGADLATFVFRVRDLSKLQAALAAEVPSVELLPRGQGQMGYALVFAAAGARWVIPVPDERLPRILETQHLINTLPTFVRDESGATLSLQEYVTDLDHDWSGRYTAARAAFDRGELHAAAELVEASCRESPKALPHTHALLGQIRLRLGDPAAARSALDAAIAASRATDGSIVRGAASALRALADELERAGYPAPVPAEVSAALARSLAPIPAGRPASKSVSPPSGALRWWAIAAVVAVLTGLGVFAARQQSEPGSAQTVAPAASAAGPLAVASPAEVPERPLASRREPLESLTKEAAALVIAAKVLPAPSGARGPYRGFIRRIPKQGGAGQTVAEDATGDALVLDATHAYWLERRFGQTPGRVFRVSKAGGKPQKVFEDCEPMSLAVDGTALYVSTRVCQEFCGPGAVFSLGKDGSGRRELARLDHPLGLSVDGDRLYLIAGCGVGALYRVDPRGGGKPRLLAESGGERYVTDGERLYRASLWTLFVEDMASGKTLEAIDIASDSGRDATITDFAQDRAALYFPTFGKGTVERWTKSGGAPAVIASLGGRPKRIVADERDLFVSDPYVNVIWRIPKAGGAPVVLARESQPPEALTLDDQFVYWLAR